MFSFTVVDSSALAFPLGWIYPVDPHEGLEVNASVLLLLDLILCEV